MSLLRAPEFAFRVLAACVVLGCHGDSAVTIGTEHLGPCAIGGLASQPFATMVTQNSSSPWFQPSRAWQETWPAARLHQAAGVRLTDLTADAFASRARLAAAAGLGRLAFTVNWSDISFDDPSVLDPAAQAALTTKLALLASLNLRPIISVSGTASSPVPLRTISLRLVAGAAVGATQVALDAASAALVVPGRTGMNVSGVAAAILIVAVDTQNVATLSRPLASALAAGTYPGATLKYAPFRWPQDADGNADPLFEETFAGWLAFVHAVATVNAAYLGTHGFDLVLWGTPPDSRFLNINNYYDPPLAAGIGDIVEIVPRTMLRRTMAALHADFPTVKLGDGFVDYTYSTPEAASTEFSGSSAIVRVAHVPGFHYPADWQREQWPSLDPTGRLDGARGSDGLWDPAFIPTLDVLFPEGPLAALTPPSFRPGQLYRELSPTPIVEGNGTLHGSTVNGADGHPIELWISGIDLDPSALLAAPLSDDAQVRLATKSALRSLVAYAGMGAAVVTLASTGDDQALIDQAATAGGPTLAAVGRLMAALPDLGATTVGPALWVVSIDSCGGAQQFAGDGTPAHPPLLDRDVVAVFPFRLGPSDIAVAAYVMTRNLVAGDRPASLVQLTFEGIDAASVSVSATDPLADVAIPISVLARQDQRVTVELPLQDWPVIIRLRTPP